MKCNIKEYLKEVKHDKFDKRLLQITRLRLTCEQFTQLVSLGARIVEIRLAIRKDL